MGALRILVAEDMPVNRMVLERMLCQFGEVVAVENGSEAVQAAEEALLTDDPFDLILLDISMPVMDGIAALHAIREAEKRHGEKRSQVFMVTAHGSPDYMLQALENEGCDEFIVKPVIRRSLLALLEKHRLV